MDQHEQWYLRIRTCGDRYSLTLHPADSSQRKKFSLANYKKITVHPEIIWMSIWNTKTK